MTAQSDPFTSTPYVACIEMELNCTPRPSFQRSGGFHDGTFGSEALERSPIVSSLCLMAPATLSSTPKV